MKPLNMPPPWFCKCMGFPDWWIWTFYLCLAVTAWHLGAVPRIEQGGSIGEGEL